MKKIFALLSLSILIAGGSAFAQIAPPKDGRFRDQQRGERAARVQRERQTPEEYATERTTRLDAKLDLNKSQEKKVYALFLQQAQERDQQFADRQTGERRGTLRRNPNKESFAKYDAELKKILKKKQYAKLEADRKEMRSIMEPSGTRRDRDFKRGDKRQRLEKQDS